MSNLLSTNDVSRLLKISKNTITYRCRELKIGSRKGKPLMIDEDNLELIRTFSKNRFKNLNFKKKYHKVNILIVEYYLSRKDNSIPDIAKNLGVTETKVHNAINQFLKDGYVTVQSKLN